MLEYALERAQRAYSAMARRDKEIRWPIIPDRRWDAVETDNGIVVTGYENCLPLLGFDGPVASYRLRNDRLTRLN